MLRNFTPYLSSKATLYLGKYVGEFTFLEKKHTKTAQSSSATTKMWLVEFIAQAILIWLLNTKGWLPHWLIINPDSGFSDFDANWYYFIGSTIVYSTFFMALEPFTRDFSSYFEKAYYRARDRNWTQDMTITK